jgi:hypothetical protein
VTRKLCALRAHPAFEFVDERRDMLLAIGKALFGGFTGDGALGGKDGVDLLHRFEGERRDNNRLLVARLGCDIGEHEELPPRVGPTCGFRDRRRLPRRLVKPAKAGIGVRLQDTAVMRQVPFGMIAHPIARKEIDRRRRVFAPERGIVADISPQPRLHGFCPRQQRHRRVIAVNPFGREDMDPDEIGQRRKQCGARAHMIGQSGEREVYAFARETLALPVQGLMEGELVVQDHGQEVRSHMAARNSVERSRRLRNLLAGPARELLPHMLDHLPLTRDHFQGLGDILAQLRKLGRSAAGALRRSRHDHPLARQMLGERLLNWPFARMGRNRNAGRTSRPLSRTLVFGCRSFQLFELELHLVEEPLRAFGSRAVKLALELLDGELQMGNQGFGARDAGLRASSFRLSTAGFGGILPRLDPRRDDERLQRLDIIGKRIARNLHDASESQIEFAVIGFGKNANEKLSPRFAAAMSSADGATRSLRACKKAAPA